MTRPLAILLALSLTFLGGCASNTKTISANQALSVPTLKVEMACGNCQVRPNVPALIQEGYNTAAANAGAKVVPSSEAILTIKEYSERGDAARFLAGAFAGKDEIKATVASNNKQFAVEDYYRNAWQGIESLARKIGSAAFEQLQ